MIVSGDSGGSQQNTCSGGQLTVASYNDSACQTLSGQNTYSTNTCYGGSTIFSCSTSPTPTPPAPSPTATPSYVVLQGYASTGCTGTSAGAAAYPSGACQVDGASSTVYTCNNNIPYVSFYSTSTSCTGASTTPTPYPAQCQR